MGPTRTRGGRKYADEVKPSEDAAATPIPLPAPIYKRRLPKGSLFCYSEWRDEEPRKSGADKDERRTEVRRRGGTERGRSGNAYHLRI